MSFDGDKRKFVRDFINEHCIERTQPGNQTYLAGYGTSTPYIWQFYLRAAMLHPAVIELVTDHFFSVFGSIIPDIQIAGVESSSTSLLTAFVMRAASMGINLNAFSIRKERKGYGKRNWIEGFVTLKPVLIIDDIISENHKTIHHADRVLNMHRIATVNHAYCLVHKQKDRSVPVVLERGPIKVHSMFYLNDFDLTYKDYHAAKAR
jgi:orotate phosphoribosyltransferase